jgi:ABC-type nitrate/sulfonate/bicarbonate transport system substrate-binding protein
VLSTVGIYFAIDNGFMAEQGIDVQVMPYSSDALNMRALLASDADIIETAPSTVFLAHGNGANVKIIDSPVDRPTDSIVVSKDINSFADLAGKTFAISAPTDSSQVEAQILARQAGMDPSSINFVAIGGPPDRATALLAGRAQAASLTILTLQPILDAIDKGDLHVLTTMSQAFPDLPLAYDATRDDFAQNKSDVLNRFVTAEIKGYRWAEQNPEQAAAIAEKYIQGVPPDLMVRGMQGLIALNAWGLDGGVSADGLSRTQNLLMQQGVITSVAPPSDVLAPQYMQAANNTLGPPPPQH